MCLGYSLTYLRKFQNVYWHMTVFGRPDVAPSGRQGIKIQSPTIVLVNSEQNTRERHTHGTLLMTPL